MSDCVKDLRELRGQVVVQVVQVATPMGQVRTQQHTSATDARN
jgi:hypothetical protein